MTPEPTQLERRVPAPVALGTKVPHLKAFQRG